ncbi:hypothetical protein ACO1O0_001585 [Amphichorda felina]
MAVEPGMPPPEGMVSNFENPDREMYYICIVSNVIAIPVTTLFMALRVWSRYKLSMKFQADDIAFFIGYTVYATMVNYGPTVFATKAAILLFLIRIFAPYRTYVKWIYGFLAVMAVYYVTMMLLKIFICRPISMFWGATTDGECFNQPILILVDNIISLISDIVVLLIPCPLTRQLQVGLMAKIKIAVVFGVGGMACIFSLVRLVFIINNGQSEDQTYAFVQINLLGIAEVGIGLVCACFPLMPALWKSIFQKDTPGYSSNTKSQFEMMSSQKTSRNATHNHGTITYKDDAESDEGTLIPGTSRITTNIHGGGQDGEHIGAGGNSPQRKTSFGGTEIIRTVEVHQYHEQ